MLWRALIQAAFPIVCGDCCVSKEAKWYRIGRYPEIRDDIYRQRN
jgi:hypothetical protein